MAKTLDEVIASLSAEEKKLFENTLSKNQDLKDGWLRQDDYSRKMTELKAKETEYTSGLEETTRLKAWADVNVPRYNKVVQAGLLDEEGNELWSQQKTELERRIAEEQAKAVGGEDMDPEKLKATVTEIIKNHGGGLTKEEIDALVKEEGRKLSQQTFDENWEKKQVEFNDKTIPFVTGFATSMATAAMKYEKETGKDFTVDDQKAVFELMTQKKNYNPREVMDEYMKPHRDKKQTDAEVERRVAEELAKRGMPGGGGEMSIPSDENRKGSIRQMMERSAGEDDFETTIREAAVKSAKELSAEGKF